MTSPLRLALVLALPALLPRVVSAVPESPEEDTPSQVAPANPTALPAPDAILADLRRANDYFLRKWPDPGAPLTFPRPYPSHLWTRAVYMEGLMALQHVTGDPAPLDYAVRWGQAHDWQLRQLPQRPERYVRHADNQCAAQTYLELYEIDPKPERLAAAKEALDAMLATDRIDDWTWIDALQMGMPIFARLTAITGDPRYAERMYEMYAYARDRQGAHGLYNPADRLWWRDGAFDPPYSEPNGEDCYWSRGNGWVIVAMARVLEVLPADDPHRDAYITMLRDMAGALVTVQRRDGYWNVSLHDPSNFGGPETSGTACFVAGLAYGVRSGLLDRDKYLPAVVAGWHALSGTTLREDGFLRYTQSTGKQPSDGQPVRADKVPDFEDFGLGCFLLAGTEVYALATGQTGPDAPHVARPAQDPAKE